jgi:hypothetical protein
MSWTQVAVREAQDLEPAVTHRLGGEPRILVDDHGPEVELPALESDELLVDALSRQGDVKLLKRGEHLAGDAFGAAADGPDADAHAPEVRQCLDPFSAPAEEDERLSLAQPTDELERVAGGPAHAILHEGKLHVTQCPARHQPGDILDRASRCDVVDAPLLLPGLRGKGTDDRIVVATLARRQDAHP